MSEDKKTLDKTVEFFGKDVKINEVKNPHLKRAITGNITPEYDDHSRTVIDPNYSEWNQSYSDYRVKYHQTVYGDHAEKH